MDMLSLLRSCGIKFYRAEDGIQDKHIRKNSSWVQMVCPVCGTDHLWLGYDTEKDYFNCFNHGHATAYELFREWFPDRNPREFLDLLDKAPHEEVEELIKTGSYKPPVPVCPLLDFKRHCAYVKGRGLDPEEMAHRWEWGAIPINGEQQYRDRLFFPVHNRDGVPVSWQTRTILQNQTIRYLTAPKDREAESIKSLLYGEHLVDPYKTVIICEGVFDAVSVGVNAVATFGKKLTQAQRLRIAWYPKRIICFDDEKDTKEQARELAALLEPMGGKTDCVFLDAHDPATAPRHEIDALLRHAGLV